MVAASIVAFLVAQAVLSGHRPTFSLADGSTLRVVVGTGVYLTLVGLHRQRPGLDRPQHAGRPGRHAAP